MVKQALRLLVLIGCMTFGTKQALAQKAVWNLGASAGYQYQHGNYLKLSGWALLDQQHAGFFKVDAGANFSWMQQKTTVIPELGLSYYFAEQWRWAFLKAEVTPYTVTPKVGLSIVSLLDLGLGYGFEFNKKKDFVPIEGFTVSVGLNIPLKIN